jgi:repressor of nif and glnA expression
MKEEKLKKMSEKLSRLKVRTEFNLIKIPDGDVLISCSDLDHYPVDNFVDNISFCRSTYSIDKDDMKVYHVMSEVDVEYHGVDTKKVYKALKDYSGSLKPYVAYMTINGEDVNPEEYLEFNSLNIIWD